MTGPGKNAFAAAVWLRSKVSTSEFGTFRFHMFGRLFEVLQVSRDEHDTWEVSCEARGRCSADSLARAYYDCNRFRHCLPPVLAGELDRALISMTT